MKLSKEEIKAIIPHRDPMLLVDTVEEMEAGDHLVTTFFVDPTREIFKGHFPGEPVLPGVYSVECMAQTADILLLSAERYAGKIPLFLGINNVRFLKKILPGDTIEIHAKMASERVEKAIGHLLRRGLQPRRAGGDRRRDAGHALSARKRRRPGKYPGVPCVHLMSTTCRRSPSTVNLTSCPAKRKPYTRSGSC